MTPQDKLGQKQEVSIDEWDDMVRERYKIPRNLWKAMSTQESGGDWDATSPTGVKGKYQVTEATAKQYGLDRNDPFQQTVAAARYLRDQYDALKDLPEDNARWLGAVGRYYGGPGAVDSSGGVSTKSPDGVSTPDKHIERVAKLWGQFERSGQDTPPVDEYGRATVDETGRPIKWQSVNKPAPAKPPAPKIQSRGPVRKPAPLPTFDGDPTQQMLQDVAARPVTKQKQGDVLPTKPNRFQQRSTAGQIGEILTSGAMRGVEGLYKAASIAHPQAWGKGLMTPEAQQALQQQEAEQDVEYPTAAPVARGLTTAGVQAPVYMAGGAAGLPAAMLTAGYMNAAQEDWSKDPVRSAVRTGINATLPFAASRGANALIRPITRPGVVATESIAGAAGNVVPEAIEQMAFEGQLDPQRLAQTGLMGGLSPLNVTGAGRQAEANQQARLAKVQKATGSPVTAEASPEVAPEAAPAAPEEAATPRYTPTPEVEQGVTVADRARTRVQSARDSGDVVGEINALEGERQAVKAAMASVGRRDAIGRRALGERLASIDQEISQAKAKARGRTPQQPQTPPETPFRETPSAEQQRIPRTPTPDENAPTADLTQDLAPTEREIDIPDTGTLPPPDVPVTEDLTPPVEPQTPAVRPQYGRRVGAPVPGEAQRTGPREGRKIKVTVEGREQEATLTPEQAKAWDEAERDYQETRKNTEANTAIDPTDKAKKLKALGMKHAARKRAIAGVLTGKEQEAATKREASNYKGKRVSVEGREGEVVGNAFGKVKVQFDDGTTSNVAPDAIQTAPKPKAPPPPSRWAARENVQPGRGQRAGGRIPGQENAVPETPPAPPETPQRGVNTIFGRRSGTPIPGKQGSRTQAQEAIRTAIEDAKARRKPPAPPKLAGVRPQVLGENQLQMPIEAGSRTGQGQTLMYGARPHHQKRLNERGRNVIAEQQQTVEATASEADPRRQLAPGDYRGNRYVKLGTDEAGKLASYLFESNTPESIAGESTKGREAFLHDPDVKGALGLTKDAGEKEIKEALNRELAGIMNIRDKAGRTPEGGITLRSVPVDVWKMWARRKSLPASAMAKFNRALRRLENPDATPPTAPPDTPQPQRREAPVRRTPASDTGRQGDAAAAETPAAPRAARPAAEPASDHVNVVDKAERGSRWSDDSIVNSSMVGSRASTVYEVRPDGPTVTLSYDGKNTIAHAPLGSFDTPEAANRAARAAGAKSATNLDSGDLTRYWAKFDDKNDAWDFASSRDEGQPAEPATRADEQPARAADDRPVTYHRGDEARYTGKTIDQHGGTFYEIEVVEGRLAGQKFHTPRRPDGFNPAVERVKQERQAEQEEWKRLREAEQRQKQPAAPTTESPRKKPSQAQKPKSRAKSDLSQPEWMGKRLMTPEDQAAIEAERQSLRDVINDKVVFDTPAERADAIMKSRERIQEMEAEAHAREAARRRAAEQPVEPVTPETPQAEAPAPPPAPKPRRAAKPVAKTTAPKVNEKTLTEAGWQKKSPAEFTHPDGREIYRSEKGTWVVARDGETASSHESLREAIASVAGESSPPRGENVPAPKSTPLADDVLRRPQPPMPEDAQPIPPPREPLNMPLPEPELPSKRTAAPEPPAAKPKAQRKAAKPAAEAQAPASAVEFGKPVTYSGHRQVNAKIQLGNEWWQDGELVIRQAERGGKDYIVQTVNGESLSGRHSLADAKKLAGTILQKAELHEDTTSVFVRDKNGDPHLISKSYGSAAGGDVVDIESQIKESLSFAAPQPEAATSDLRAKASDLKARSPFKKQPKFVTEAEARLKDASSGKLAGSGAQALADQAIVSGYKLYKAGMAFKDWTRQMLREFGGKVRPYLRDTWQKLTSAAKEFYRDEEGSVPASPGPPRRNRVTEAVRQNAARQPQQAAQRPLTPKQEQQQVRREAQKEAAVQNRDKDMSVGKMFRSPLSNLNYTGTYERLAGQTGKEISEAIRNYQVFGKDKEGSIADLRRELKPKIEEVRGKGLSMLADQMEAHIDSLQEPAGVWKQAANKLKGFQYNAKLRLNPRSTIINLAQPMQTLWPHLSSRDMLSIYREAVLGGGWKRVHDLALSESGGKVEGIDTSVKQGGFADRYLNWFGKTSDLNRVVGHLAGERIADRLGLTGDAKKRMAADWAKKVEFDNSKYDVPPAFRGDAASVLMQFKPFMVKNLERIASDWNKGIEGVSDGDLARRSKMVVGQIALGGMKSVIPGVAHLKAIGGVFVLGTLAKQLGKYMDQEYADKVAETMFFGLPGLFGGQDWSGSVGIIDEPFGTTTWEKIGSFLLGPTVSTAVKLIDGVAGVVGAEDDAKRGAALTRTVKGITPFGKSAETVISAVKNQGKPSIKTGKTETPMTTRETIATGITLGMGTPIRQSNYYDQQDIDKDLPKTEKAAQSVMGVQYPGLKRLIGEQPVTDYAQSHKLSGEVAKQSTTSGTRRTATRRTATRRAATRRSSRRRAIGQ